MLCGAASKRRECISADGGDQRVVGSSGAHMRIGNRGGWRWVAPLAGGVLCGPFWRREDSQEVQDAGAFWRWRRRFLWERRGGRRRIVIFFFSAGRAVTKTLRANAMNLFYLLGPLQPIAKP